MFSADENSLQTSHVVQLHQLPTCLSRHGHGEVLRCLIYAIPATIRSDLLLGSQTNRCGAGQAGVAEEGQRQDRRKAFGLTVNSR